MTQYNIINSHSHSHSIDNIFRCVKRENGDTKKEECIQFLYKNNPIYLFLFLSFK